MVFPFPRGIANDLFVEVFEADESWRNSGALAIRDLHEARNGTTWVARENDVLVAWVETASAYEQLLPRTGLLPVALIAAGGGRLHDHSQRGISSSSLHPLAPARPAAAPVHVPLPTPREDQKKRVKPPIIEKHPLPPV
jgi:hypothetical protein